jgi:hypothetical protein
MATVLIFYDGKKILISIDEGFDSLAVKYRRRPWVSSGLGRNGIITYDPNVSAIPIKAHHLLNSHKRMTDLPHCYLESNDWSYSPLMDKAPIKVSLVLKIMQSLLFRTPIKENASRGVVKYSE